MKRVRLTLVALMMCLPGVAGCLIMHHHTKYEREAEQRKMVVFQTETAERVFKARAMNDEVRDSQGKSNFVAIPFLLMWSSTRVKSQPAFYNDQILACDTNGDRQISESEALAYNPTYFEPDTENLASGPIKVRVSGSNVVGSRPANRNRRSTVTHATATETESPEDVHADSGANPPSL